MTPLRATAVLRRGNWDREILGWAFHVEQACWFFVPDSGAPEHLFGKRTAIVFEEKRQGPRPRARVVRRETVKQMVEMLRQMLEGL